MAGPMRTNEVDQAIKPPRPPNSWILYRRHILKNLPPVGPGEPRRSQSDVSTLISGMWRDASPDIKSHFERLADEAKTAHKLKYPHYRYQPQKKEDKHRIKEVQKQQKETQKASKKIRGVGQSSSSASTIHSAPQPGAPYYNPHLIYNSAGPTPPMSAASSPSDATPSPISSTHPIGPATRSPSVLAAPLSLPTPIDVVPTTPLPFPLVSSCLLPNAEAQVADTNLEWQTRPQILQAQPGEETDSPSEWGGTGLAVHEQHTSSNQLSFDLPNGQYTWEQPNGDYLGDFSSTVFHLDDFDASLLSSHPQGELEVSMGNQSQLLDNNYNILASDDQALHSTLFDQPFTAVDFMHMFPDMALQNTSFPTLVDSSNTAYTNSIPSNSTSVAQELETSSSYAPPAGAAYSSTRRVGGNWANSIFAREYVLACTPPQQEVHAS